MDVISGVSHWKFEDIDKSMVLMKVLLKVKGEKNFEIKDCERIQKNMSNGRVISSPHFPVVEFFLGTG